MSNASSKETEQASLYNYPFFRVTNGRPELYERVLAVNSTSLIFAALRNWATPCAAKVAEGASSEDLNLFSKAFAELTGKLSETTNFTHPYARPDESVFSPRGSFDEGIKDSAQSLLATVGYSLTLPEEKDLPEPPTIDQLTALLFKVRGINHNLSQSFTNVSGYIGLMLSRKNTQDLLNNTKGVILNVSKDMTEVESILQGTTPKQRFTMRELHSMLFYDLLVPLEVRGGIKHFIVPPKFDLGEISTELTYHWIEEMWRNIYWNKLKVRDAIKSPFELIIDYRRRQDKGVRYTELWIEDDVLPFPEELVRNGFQEGYSGFQQTGIGGTGIGMNYQDQRLREFGGKLIPANNRSGGSRLKIRLREL